MLEGVGGFVALALFLIWWRLGSVLNELKSLNHKAEFWGKDRSENGRELHALVAGIDASASATAAAAESISQRASELYPTDEELRRRGSHD